MYDGSRAPMGACVGHGGDRDTIPVLPLFGCTRCLLSKSHSCCPNSVTFVDVTHEFLIGGLPTIGWSGWLALRCDVTCVAGVAWAYLVLCGIV